MVSFKVCCDFIGIINNYMLIVVALSGMGRVYICACVPAVHVSIVTDLIQCVCYVCVCGSFHRMNEIVTLLNLTLFIYNFYTWLIVKFCLFVNAQYEWNVTMTNSCVCVNVIGD